MTTHEFTERDHWEALPGWRLHAHVSELGGYLETAYPRDDEQRVDPETGYLLLPGHEPGCEHVKAAKAYQDRAHALLEQFGYPDWSAIPGLHETMLRQVYQLSYEHLGQHPLPGTVVFLMEVIMTGLLSGYAQALASLGTDPALFARFSLAAFTQDQDAPPE